MHPLRIAGDVKLSSDCYGGNITVAAVLMLYALNARKPELAASVCATAVRQLTVRVVFAFVVLPPPPPPRSGTKIHISLFIYIWGWGGLYVCK